MSTHTRFGIYILWHVWMCVDVYVFSHISTCELKVVSILDPNCVKSDCLSQPRKSAIREACACAIVFLRWLYDATTSMLQQGELTLVSVAADVTGASLSTTPDSFSLSCTHAPRQKSRDMKSHDALAHACVPTPTRYCTHLVILHLEHLLLHTLSTLVFC